MTLQQRVEELTMDYGNNSKKLIGEFVLRKKGRLNEYTIRQIADETFTSKAALVRFAKSLGYGGWKEFVKEFVAEYRYQESHYSDIDPNFPFREDDTTLDIIQKMSSLQVESILDTADLLDPHTIEKAAGLLMKSNRIAVLGKNPNILLGELFQRRMLTIQKSVEVSLLGDAGLLASSLKKEDCAILISYSGNTDTCEPTSLLQILEARRVPTIAITSCGSNMLRRHADYTFSISSRERLYSKISTFATEKSIQFILDILFSACFSLSYEKNLDIKINTGRLLEYGRIATNQDIREMAAEE